VKIALIAPTSLPSTRANTIQVMKMAQAFGQIGHSVHLLARASRPEPPSWGELASHYGLSDPIPIEWLLAAASLRGYDFGLRAVESARRLGADLVYTRHPQAAALASTRAAATILESHDLPGGRMGPFLMERFLRGRGARRLVIITQALAQALAERYAIPAPPFLHVAPDGVDLERYRDLPDPASARAALNLPEMGGFTAGYSGSLYAGRGLELIIELAQRLPEVHFLLAGGSPVEVGRLRETARQRGIGNLTLTGFIPNHTLPHYQAACDILLMPYQRKVAASSGGDIAPFLSPMKLFEYLACGRPILSGDLPVLREVLNEQNAVLLPPDDLDAWTAAVRSLQADHQKREALGHRARRDAQRHSWTARAQAVLDGLEW
jgi:glycosyltransferase involved in cell wall biosynthesis